MKKVIGIFSLFLLVFVLGGCSYKVVKTEQQEQLKPEVKTEVINTQSPLIQSTSTTQKLNDNSINLEQQCFDYGNKLIENYKKNNGTQTVVDPIFHYNKSLEKCYVYVSLAPYQNCESSRSLFDTYENKVILNACFTKENIINYVDSTKYPVEIIDQLKFNQIKNSLLELSK